MVLLIGERKSKVKAVSDFRHYLCGIASGFVWSALAEGFGSEQFIVAKKPWREFC